MEILDWDSKFFNIKVGELVIKDITQVSVRDSIFDLIYVRSNIDFKLIKSNYTISSEEVKIVYSKKINCENVVESDSIINLYDLKSFNLGELYNLAFHSGKYSRFNKDPKISRQKFHGLYKKWIDNALNKTFNDYFIISLVQNQIISLLTMKNFSSYSQIGLLAVDKRFEGRGIGSKMLSVAENYCFTNHILDLRIPTQEENKQACNFYVKNGYKIIDRSIIKHLWKNE